MDEKLLKDLDNVMNVAIINLYTISKKDNIIRLESVDFNDDRHWAVLNLVVYLCSYMDRIAYLEMSFWQFLKLRFKLKNKNLKRVKNNGGLTCDCFIADIELAYPNLEEPFMQIAKLYYPRKKK